MYLSETTNELYRMFNALNEKYFDGVLEEPIITIQKTRKGTRGWYETSPLWIKNGDGEDVSKYEVNISSRLFQILDDDDIVELAGVLLHELCHHYDNTIKKVKDCSGRIHNKAFKKTAEEVGLEVEQSKSVGFGITEPGEDLRTYILEELKPNKNALVYYHKDVEKPAKEKKPKTEYIYTCPECSRQFKLKDNFPLDCGTCHVPFDVELLEE